MKRLFVTVIGMSLLAFSAFPALGAGAESGWVTITIKPRPDKMALTPFLKTQVKNKGGVSKEEFIAVLAGERPAKDMNVGPAVVLSHLAQILSEKFSWGVTERFGPELVLDALREAEVVPCDWKPGDVEVHGLNPKAPTELFYITRACYPGEKVLRYKGVDLISLLCGNTINDKRKIAPPTTTTTTTTTPSTTTTTVPSTTTTTVPPPVSKHPSVTVVVVVPGVTVVQVPTLSVPIPQAPAYYSPPMYPAPVMYPPPCGYGVCGNVSIGASFAVGNVAVPAAVVVNPPQTTFPFFTPAGNGGQFNAGVLVNSRPVKLVPAFVPKPVHQPFLHRPPFHQHFHHGGPVMHNRPFPGRKG